MNIFYVIFIDCLVKCCIDRFMFCVHVVYADHITDVVYRYKTKDI